MYVCVNEGACGVQKRVSDFLELELQVIIELPDVDAGNHIQVFCKNGKCSKFLFLKYI